MADPEPEPVLRLPAPEPEPEPEPDSDYDTCDDGEGEEEEEHQSCVFVSSENFDASLLTKYGVIKTEDGLIALGQRSPGKEVKDFMCGMCGSDGDYGCVCIYTGCSTCMILCTQEEFEVHVE
jgi:hypothetical protein